MLKRSVTIAGHRTSISLEPEFWDALRAIAKSRRLSLSALIAGIDADAADREGGLSSTLRVFVLKETQSRSEAHG